MQYLSPGAICSLRRTSKKYFDITTKFVIKRIENITIRPKSSYRDYLLTCLLCNFQGKPADFLKCDKCAYKRNNTSLYWGNRNICTLCFYSRKTTETHSLMHYLFMEP